MKRERNPAWLQCTEGVDNDDRHAGDDGLSENSNDNESKYDDYNVSLAGK